jgi:hypothetical protein
VPRAAAGIRDGYEERLFSLLALLCRRLPGSRWAAAWLLAGPLGLCWAAAWASATLPKDLEALDSCALLGGPPGAVLPLLGGLSGAEPCSAGLPDAEPCRASEAAA